MQTREDLFLSLPKGAACLEIGVRYGDLSGHVMDRREDLLYFGVDSYEGAFAQAGATGQAKFNRPNAKLIILDSVSAAMAWGGPKLDLIYIDGAHDYEAVTADLVAWWRHLKPGGIFSGHDFETKADDGFWGPIEVERAVTEWAGKKGLPIQQTMDAPPSWYVVKP